MRKVISIFFLSLFLLYQVGYLGYYWFSAHQINEKWMSHVDVTPDMKHVSIPIELPYWTNQSEYRITHGKININGELYRKVMQKYENNAIHLIVAKDSDTAKLNQSISDWVKAMSDSEQSSSDNGKADLLKSIKDYIPRTSFSEFNSIAQNNAIDQSFTVSDEKMLPGIITDTHTPPPQA